MPSPKRMSVRKMGTVGHYKPPKMKGSGQMNMPRRGRVGKNIPAIKQFTPMGVRRRGR